MRTQGDGAANQAGGGGGKREGKGRRRGKGRGRGRGGQKKPDATDPPQRSQAAPQPRDGEGRRGKGRGRGDNRQKSPPKAEPKEFAPAPYVHVPKRYGIVVFESFAEAKAKKDEILAKSSEVDQINVVIKAEGNMDDAELNAIPGVKVFAGAAWALIHERRIADGWYDEPR